MNSDDHGRQMTNYAFYKTLIVKSRSKRIDYVIIIIIIICTIPER